MGNTGNQSNKGKSYKKHFDNLKTLNRKKKYKDGTYNTKSLESVTLTKGYQASYWQMSDKYNQKQHDEIINNTIAKLSDKNVYAGKFGGAPELSFNFSSKAQAMAYAKKYNQISIWDWKNGKEIPNPYYKKGKGNG